MMEMDKLHRAQLYLRQLADGIDPISGKELPSDTVLNQVRLSRCFFYVAELLNQVIANAGEIGRAAQGARARAIKREFVWLEEFARDFPYSEQPIPISQLANMISAAAAASNTRKLNYAKLTDWLVREGYLANEVKNERTLKRPTQKGEEIGIVCERRLSAMGIAYDVVLYRESAQRYIVENLERILEDSLEDRALSWSEEDAEKLQQEARRGDSVQEMAERHNCSEDEIKKRLQMMQTES